MSSAADAPRPARARRRRGAAESLGQIVLAFESIIVFLGGLVIYCGGCMLHVRERMPEVVDQVVKAMGGAPFVGAFTFGEQGAIIDNCNRHGNLMVSALTFG